MQDNKPYESESSKLYQDREAHTIRGVVQDLKTVKLENDEPFMQVHLKTPDEVVNVHLGPEWFMTEQINRIEIMKGRELAVTGSGNVWPARRSSSPRKFETSNGTDDYGCATVMAPRSGQEASGFVNALQESE